jgi:hypothetical protein
MQKQAKLAMQKQAKQALLGKTARCGRLKPLPKVAPCELSPTPPASAVIESSSPQTSEIQWPVTLPGGIEEKSAEKLNEKQTADAQVKPKESSAQADKKSFLPRSARLHFELQGAQAQILQVPAIPDRKHFGYVVEKVWELPRPDVIISITGGADNFDLPLEHKDRMMRGIMPAGREGKRQLKSWSVSAFYACCFARL